jgi:hypothetical protein
MQEYPMKAMSADGRTGDFRVRRKKRDRLRVAGGLLNFGKPSPQTGEAISSLMR